MLRWPVDPVRALAAQTLPEPGRTPVAYEMKWDGGHEQSPRSAPSLLKRTLCLPTITGGVRSVPLRPADRSCR